MNSRVLAFLGICIFATLLGLMSTYKEYKPAVELLISVIGVVGSLLGIYELFLGRRR